MSSCCDILKTKHTYVPSDQKKGEPSESLINATMFNEMVGNLARMFIIHEEVFCKNLKKDQM